MKFQINNFNGRYEMFLYSSWPILIYYSFCNECTVADLGGFSGGSLETPSGTQLF